MLSRILTRGRVSVVAQIRVDQLNQSIDVFDSYLYYISQFDPNDIKGESLLHHFGGQSSTHIGSRSPQRARLTLQRPCMHRPHGGHVVSTLEHDFHRDTTIILLVPMFQSQ